MGSMFQTGLAGIALLLGGWLGEALLLMVLALMLLQAIVE